MDLRQCQRHADLEAAHADEDVSRAAYLLARLRLQPFLVLAVGQMTLAPSSPAPLTRTLQSLVRRHAMSPDHEAAAFELLNRCYSIATKPDYPGPSTRRGAFLERLVVELLLYRGLPQVRQEISLRFAAMSSPCLDVVGVDDPRFEVFECKMLPDDLEPGTFSMLRELIDLGDAERFAKDIIPTIATLWPSEELEDAIWRREIIVPEGLYQATLENILGLSIGVAKTPLN
jgi:hypothetical protein